MYAECFLVKINHHSQPCTLKRFNACAIAVAAAATKKKGMQTKAV